MRRAMARLPAPHWAVLALRDLEEMSYEEIAVVLDLKVGTVKSRINRAWMEFRDAYGCGAAGERVEVGVEIDEVPEAPPWESSTARGSSTPRWTSTSRRWSRSSGREP